MEYDSSQVSRMLYELKAQEAEIEEQKFTNKYREPINIGRNLFNIWSQGQDLETSRLMATKKYVPKKLNPFIRPFTSAKNRVELISKPAMEVSKPNTMAGKGKIEFIPKEEFEELLSAKYGSHMEVSKPNTMTSSSNYFQGPLPAIGTALSAYDTISSWNKHKDNKGLNRGLDVGRTALSAATMIPGPHQPYAAAGSALVSLLDAFI